MAAPALMVAATRPGRVWDNLAMNARSKILALAFVFIAALGGIVASLHRQHHLTPLSSGSRLSPSQTLPDFTLIDGQGRAFGPTQLKGHWSILFFGYTNCPDFCPTTLTTLAALEKRLQGQGEKTLPQVVFISVDAKRDTPAQLSRYVPYFDPSFVGLTAADQQSIEAVAKKFNVPVIVNQPKEPGGNYTVDHAGYLFVVDPDGKMAAILTGPFKVDELASDWRKLISGAA
jgi:protein SCO1/2